MSGLAGFQQTIADFKNTLVLYGFDLYRLVDVIDGEDDYYWVLHDLKQEIHASCVGAVIRLKGVLPERDYNHLRIVWNQNTTEKAD